jgi:hypothetical protein
LKKTAPTEEEEEGVGKLRGGYPSAADRESALKMTVLIGGQGIVYFLCPSYTCNSTSQSRPPFVCLNIGGKNLEKLFSNFG